MAEDTGEVERPPLLLDGCPESVRELAASCVDYVRQAVGFDLDLQADTLSVLDHYVAGARTEVIERPELLPLLARAVGAYFGEMVRREHGGFWHVPGVDSHEWAVCLSDAFLCFNPVGVAHEALTLGTGDGGPAGTLRFAPDERAAIEARLAAMPPVDEEEYYALCTRWDVIELAHETLRALMQQGGVEETVYELEDYEAVLAPAGSA
ncbi:MAG: hypothetical protein R3B13_19025 [Polyangiaceae bacterium]